MVRSSVLSALFVSLLVACASTRRPAVCPTTPASTTSAQTDIDLRTVHFPGRTVVLIRSDSPRINHLRASPSEMCRTEPSPEMNAVVHFRAPLEGVYSIVV